MMSKNIINVKAKSKINVKEYAKYACKIKIKISMRYE